MYEHRGYTFHIEPSEASANLPDGYMATMTHCNGFSFALFHPLKKECEQEARQAIESLIAYRNAQKPPKSKNIKKK